MKMLMDKVKVWCIYQFFECLGFENFDQSKHFFFLLKFVIHKSIKAVLFSTTMVEVCKSIRINFMCENLEKIT